MDCDLLVLLVMLLLVLSLVGLVLICSWYVFLVVMLVNGFVWIIVLLLL